LKKKRKRKRRSRAHSEDRRSRKRGEKNGWYLSAWGFEGRIQLVSDDGRQLIRVEQRLQDA